MRNYEALSDHDFELLVADLFGAKDGIRYQVYARGPDQGVDLRHVRRDGSISVIQCKHYLYSSMGQLRSAARAEATKLSKGSRPAAYRFVTSRRLTAANKQSLKNDLSPYIRSMKDVWGASDIELLIGKHPDVERRHIKLWLGSSAQLRAVLNGAIHARSRALAEEIAELLPRWVPGDAFHEARELLRNLHVCIVAGAPGVGKTTLAKLLLADAIHDGYEAIHINADIEEAWSAYEPGARQAFYYDDFLGRTALAARLGKNEEDRLISFLGRAVRSKATLCILTTREYILQQAHQLYERLDATSIEGQKYLLKLESYSRVERAQIFCAHAFVSQQLTPRARRSLERREAYLGIVDHPNYNPRQIEWVTGLGGHKLTTSDLTDYAGFVRAALDDPTRIWRHGFEHQLDDHQRGLLLVLVSMPDRVVLADLHVAFDAYCEAATIDTRKRVFERALAVLNDSFVRISHDQDEVFVEVHNPGIVDFVASYLRDSPQDALILTKGIKYFEQVQSMSRFLNDQPHSQSLATAVVGSLERCFSAPSSSWYEVYYGAHATKPTTTRRPISLEHRLSFLGDLRRQGGAYSADPLKTRMRKIYARELSRLLAAWDAGKGKKDDALLLLTAIVRCGEQSVRVVAAAKRMFMTNLFYTYAFTQLLDFHDLFPDAFERVEWARIRRLYEGVAREELENPHELSDPEDVDAIESAARKLQLPMPAATLNKAREAIRQRILDEEPADATPAPLPTRAATSAEDDEILALFSRLADA
jgi:conflict system STAND superfamily ATPase/restriction endonuclease